MALALLGCARQRNELPPVPPHRSASLPSVVWQEPFDRLDAGQWRAVALQGHTRYRALLLEGRRCLEARSDGAASILLRAVPFNPQDAPWLSWDWRVDRLVDGEALDRKDGSDSPARLYVYFKTRGLPWQKRSLDYVWSRVLPVETVLTSPFSQESKLIIAGHGDGLAQWRHVERNLTADYRRAFGGDPPDVVAIGIMSDTDSTGNHALAYFDDLRVSRIPHPPTEAAGAPSAPPE